MLRPSRLAASLILAASAMPAFADADDLETLRTECAAQLNLPSAVCDCIADKAGELSESQQAFLAATVSQDFAAAGEVRTQMSIAEVTEAGMFMAGSPQGCAKGG